MAKGKYAGVVGHLTKLPPEDANFQARVQREKEEAYAGFSVADLASAYLDLRAEKERIKADESRVNLSIAAVTQLLIDAQEAGVGDWGKYGVKDNALRLASGDTIRVHTEPYGKVLDKEAFRQWCIANGYENQLQLWPTRMNAIVKERLLNGEPEPDGTAAYSYSYIKLVGAKEDE